VRLAHGHARRSLQEVKEILGHSDLKLTLRYAHLSPSHLLAAVGALDGLTERRPERSNLAHDLAHNHFQQGFRLPTPRKCAILLITPP
jgi:hypothetical protein